MALLLGFLFFCGVTDLIGSVSITTPEQIVQEAGGEIVHLTCMFTLSPEDQGPLDIEWLRLSGPNNEAIDHVVILYAADKIYSDFYQDLKGRVHFTSNDVVSGDASIKIRNVRPADSGTYQCKVKKAPGVAKTTVQLTVIDITGSVNITTPEQTVQEAQGEIVHLPCIFTYVSKDQGPLDVEWLRLSGPNNEAIDHVVILYSADKIHDDVYPDLKGRVYFTSNDIRSGDASINITNVRLSDVGTYQCKVKTYPGIVNRNLQLAVTKLGTEPRALRLLGKRSTTELNPQPRGHGFQQLLKWATLSASVCVSRHAPRPTPTMLLLFSANFIVALQV